MIHHGDCLDVMVTMPDASVDAIVTDPPYGLGFMGKAWDHGVPAGPFWAEMLRVAKPGAYLLAFGGTRTVHRIATNIEDAGWIIRDTLVWCYASGFPKGRANLKPAWEPIVMARKPGPLRHLNIDECRIPSGGEQSGWSESGSKAGPNLSMSGANYARDPKPDDPAGRWPSNVLLSDPELFDEPNPWVVGSGATSTDGVAVNRNKAPGDWSGNTIYGARPVVTEDATYGGGGGYSRFFIIPKADRADREPVLRGQLQEGETRTYGDRAQGPDPKQTPQAAVSRANVHPTVKPTDLMRHLVRLVTPPGGTVLDPFLGSGTTALACELEGFPWIGIEKEAEYVAIAEARLNGVQRGLGLDTPLAQPVRKTSKGMGKPGASAPTYKGDFRNSRRSLDGEEPAA